MTGSINIPGLCKAKSGTLCKCGQCQHVLRREAARRGVMVQQLVENLHLDAPASPVKAPVRRLYTLGPVSTRVTVACPDGTLLQGETAVAATVFHLRKPKKK